MSGALALGAAGALLAVASLRVAAAVSPRSTSTFLLAAYVLAWAQLVAVLWALSLFGWVTWWGILAGLGLVCAAACWDTRRRSDALARIVTAGGALRDTLADPLCAVLGIAVAAAFGYALALGLATPQNDFDTIVDHLWRAALWMQNQSVGYSDCACAPYINAYPPHAEMGVLATMALGRSDRYVTLVQASAYVALAVGVVGVARRVGLGRREALLGGLLVATLPVIALQASTAQNDLVVAAFLVAAVALLLERGRAAPWLAGAATALAVGTKVTAVIGIPLLAAVVLLAPSVGRRGARLAAVVGGAVAGAYWYVVNWAHTGSWDGGFPYEPVDHSPPPTLARALRSSIQLVELPGGVGRDRWLYVVASAVLLVGAAVLGARRGWKEAAAWGSVAALVALAPTLVPDVRRYADEAYREFWQAVGRDDLAVEVGRDITRSASNVTWYGPLGVVLVVGGIVLAAVASRRGVPKRLAVVLALAPAYWLAALAVALFYQDAAGRFLMAPIALTGALWGLVLRVRPLAWGLAGVAVTALALAILNDTKRPSGLALLERETPESYWSRPRWQAQGDEVHIPDLIRYLDERVPDDARVALGITPSDAGYVVFGPDLDRRLELLRPGEVEAPGATWALVSPSARDALALRLCSAWGRLSPLPDGWEVYRRVRDRC